MRKLIRATMPSASGPVCWITMRASDQRNCAWPRTSLSKATTLSPRKLSISLAPVQASTPDSPTRWRNEVFASRRAASAFSGTASASAISFARPAGRVAARNATFPLVQRSLRSRMRTIKALSQRPSPCASNSNALAGCRPVPSPPPTRPAGPNDPASRPRSRRGEPPSSFRRAVSRAGVCSGLFMFQRGGEGRVAGGKVISDQ